MEAVNNSRNENCFLLVVTGQIETAEFISLSNVYCKYFYVYGPDWRQVGGDEEGMTPTGHKRERAGHITLNTPINGTFSSSNPFKWPQIVLSFYGYDLFGNDVIRGYSVTHLPTVPGSIKRKCPIFLPQMSTTAQRLLSLFTGRRAEFVDTKIIATAEGRDVIRVTTHGFVQLSLTATLKDINRFGYNLNLQMINKVSGFPLSWHPTSKTMNKQNKKGKISEGKATTKAKQTESVQEQNEESNWTEQTQSQKEIHSKTQ